MARLKSMVPVLQTGLLMGIAGLAVAQSVATYPGKPVRMILPYAAGGATGVSGTIFSGALQRELGQNFLVDFRPGGDTAIGTAAAARAVPDGYTILLGTSALITTHYLSPEKLFDALKDLVMITPISRSETVMLVPLSGQATFKEFVAYAKANPGALNVASNSPLNVLHYQRMMNLTGIKLTIVNYKGGGQTLPDLMAGTVQGFMNSIGSAQSLLRAGKLRGLAISGEKRNPVVPDVPTFAEFGLTDYDPNNWQAVYAPIKVPRDIQEKLNATLRKIQASPETVAALDKIGIVPNPMTLAQADKFFHAEVQRFGELIQAAGLKPGE